MGVVLTSLFGKPSYSIYINSESTTSRNFFYDIGAKVIWKPYDAMRFIAYYKYMNGQVLLEPFHLFDIIAKYTISRAWGMTLTLQNLMNHTSYGKSENLNFYTYSREVLIPGRTISLSVGYSF